VTDRLDPLDRTLVILNNLGCTTEEKAQPIEWIQERSHDRIEPGLLEGLVQDGLASRVSNRYYLTRRGILVALSYYS